jgi:hypothetical protein
MFNKKNDPLVESVKAVMKENEFRRQAEAALNEELGISSKKALPHEYHEVYDRALQNVISEGANVKHADEVMAKSVSSKVRNVVDNLTGNKGGDKPEKKKKDEDPVDAQAKRRHAYMGESNIKHPNQQKLDVHEPEKDELTKKDFEMLRAMGKNKKQIDEKLTKKMSAGKIISDFVHSKNPKFKGKSKKERQKMALGAYYGMHPEKSKRVDEESESPTGVQRFTKADARYVALQAGHRDKDTLPKVTDQIRDHINSGGSPELRKAFHMNPRDNKIHNKIYDAATGSKKVDEQMTQTKDFGLSGSVHKNAMVQPAPEVKKVSVMPGGITSQPPSKGEAEMGKMKPMNEVRMLGDKGVGKRAVRRVFGTPDEPAKLPGGRDPKDVDVRTAKVRMASKSSKLSMRESVIDEIRRNLEENLMAIHESGDEELFENYVNSLTEEELDILGLSEAGLTQSGQTPLQRAQAQVAQAAAKPVTTSRATGGAGAARAQSSATSNSLLPGQGQIPKEAPDIPNPTREISQLGPTARDVSGITDTSTGFKLSPSVGKTDMGTSTGNQIPKTPDAPRPTAPTPPAARPQPQPQQQRQRPSTPAMGSHTPFGAYGGSAGPLSLEESVKPQIKESLESFLKNRLLKG